MNTYEREREKKRESLVSRHDDGKMDAFGYSATCRDDERERRGDRFDVSQRDRAYG